MKTKNKTFKTLAIFCAIIALVVFAMTDYQVAKMEEVIYCEGVAAGEHPDYKNIYDEVCK
jgi:hypothetical protein